MIHLAKIPKPPLNAFVESLWFFKGYQPEHTKEKLLPDVGIDLVIDLDGGSKRLYEGSDWSRYEHRRNLWISGMRTRYIVIEASHDSSMMGARFHPSGASPFFRFPVSELTDRVVELDLIWGLEASRIREELLEAPTPEDKLTRLEDFLHRIAPKAFEHDQAVQYGIGRLQHFASGVTVRQLANEIGYSQKHLIHKFKQTVGLAPKMLSRLFRFQRALKLVEENDPRALGWAALAHDCGFFDQAHLIKEFQSFSSLTPKAYLAQKGDYLNYIPLD